MTVSAERMMTRRDDPETCRDAARRVLPTLSALQYQVLIAARTLHRRNAHQGVTDRELETLAQFADCRPATVRKRRGELVRIGLMRRTDERRNGMTVWQPLTDREAAEEIRARAGDHLF